MSKLDPINNPRFILFFPENIELQFYKSLYKLKKFGCDYFYFLGTNDTFSYRFCTHENWIDFYDDEKFFLNDPLKRIVENNRFILAPWNQVTYLHGNEKKPMNGRNYFGLFNGLTISREYLDRKYIFALATESKEHDLARFLLLENSNILEKVICDFIRLFDRYLIKVIISQPS